MAVSLDLGAQRWGGKWSLVGVFVCLYLWRWALDAAKTASMQQFTSHLQTRKGLKSEFPSSGALDINVLQRHCRPCRYSNGTHQEYVDGEVIWMRAAPAWAVERTDLVLLLYFTQTDSHPQTECIKMGKKIIPRGFCTPAEQCATKTWISPRNIRLNVQDFKCRWCNDFKRWDNRGHVASGVVTPVSWP